MSRVQTQETDRIRVYALDSTSTGVAGATVTVSIKRDSDGFFWSGTGFQSVYTARTMSETDSVNLPGIYHYDFLPPSADASFTYNASTTAATVVNGPWIGEVKVGYWVDNVDDAITSRASQADMTTALKRIGNSVLDIDIGRVTSIANDCLNRLLRIPT